MNILFVDDVADTRHLFSMAFVLAGHRCQTAWSAAEALGLIEQSSQPFDAGILDMNMPGMDGMELLKRIKAMPQGKNIAIILHTAYHTPEIEALAKAAGAYACLQKPMLTANLIEVVEVVVDRCRKEQENNS